MSGQRCGGTNVGLAPAVDSFFAATRLLYFSSASTAAAAASFVSWASASAADCCVLASVWALLCCSSWYFSWAERSRLAYFSSLRARASRLSPALPKTVGGDGMRRGVAYLCFCSALRSAAL